MDRSPSLLSSHLLLSAGAHGALFLSVAMAWMHAPTDRGRHRLDTYPVTFLGQMAKASAVAAHARPSSPKAPSSKTLIEGRTKTPSDSVQGDGTEGASSSAPVSEVSSYLALVRARIEENVSYPLHFRRRGITGRVEVRLRIRPDGSTSELAIEKSSGNQELDELALEATRRAAPFSEFEGALKSMGPLTAQLPIDFKLRN